MVDVRCLTFDFQTGMTNDLTSDEVRVVLKLEPHATYGFVRVTMRRCDSIAFVTISFITVTWVIRLKF